MSLNMWNYNIRKVCAYKNEYKMIQCRDFNSNFIQIKEFLLTQQQAKSKYTSKMNSKIGHICNKWCFSSIIIIIVDFNSYKALELVTKDTYVWKCVYRWYGVQNQNYSVSEWLNIMHDYADLPVNLNFIIFSFPFTCHSWQ